MKIALLKKMIKPPEPSAPDLLTFPLIFFINRLMAIRRCPYCKAIIDESQKYCNNCGTQLLFPEDEFVEEDIKGEKIVDEDFKDSEEEFEASLESSDEEEAQKEEIDLEEVLEGEAAFPGENEEEEEADAEAEEEIRAEAEDVVEARPAAEPPKKPVTAHLAPPPAPAATPPAPAPAPVKTEAVKPAPPVESEPTEPPAVKREPVRRPSPRRERPKPQSPKDAAPPSVEPVMPPPPKPAPPAAEPSLTQGPKPAPLHLAEEEERLVERSKKKAKPPAPAPTPVIEERDVQEIAADEPPDEAEDEAPLDEDLVSDEEAEDKSETDTREEIVRLIAALEKKQKKLSLTRDEEKLLAPLEDAGNLPPWADLSKSNASTEIVDEDKEEKPAGQSFAPGDTMDFEQEVMSRAETMAPTRATIGIPERVTKDKSGLLFDKEEMAKVKTDELGIPRYEMEEAGDEVSEAEVEAEEEAAELEERAVEVPKVRLGFFGRLTAFVFDLIFIALVWMGTVWAASLIMDVPVRALIKAVPYPLGGLFLILLAGYFFLFFFFLGETLGGRMAAPRD